MASCSSRSTTDHWSVKPGYFMQPWTLMSPGTMGQYPAAAMIYREGLVSPGDVLVDLNLKIADLENLQGTPMPQDASFDELRLKDVPKGTTLKADSVIDPLVHYAGRTNVAFSEDGAPPKLVDLAPYIDRAAQTVTSTNRQLKLDYGKGVLTINAPRAQGVSGNLKGRRHRARPTICRLPPIWNWATSSPSRSTASRWPLRKDPAASDERRAAHRFPHPTHGQRPASHYRHRPRSLAGERANGHRQVPSRRRR